MATLLASLLGPAPSIFGQGSLTPSAAPTPTMKSLDQIEARTPVDATHTPGDSGSAFIISAPGSYYLTGNVAVASGHGITINANGVTLDLNGFTISSTAPTAAGSGVNLTASLHDITILNGHIRGGVTAAGGVFSTGPGFQNGISWTGSFGTNPTNVRVSGVTVSGVSLNGINVSSNSTAVDHCAVSVAGNLGIGAAIVTDCVADTCGGTGINGIEVSNSRGVSFGSGSGVSAVTAAVNCLGTSQTGYGVSATDATACYGQSTDLGSSSAGVSAQTANNCYGSSSGGAGVSASSANGCYGYSSSGDGIHAFDAAQNCNGSSTSANGVYATVAQNCRGSSSTGSGISAVSAVNCYGSSGNNYAVYCTTAQTCYGISNSSYGLYASDIAIGCYGYSHTGTGLYAFIGNSSFGQNDAGTSESVTNKYNMP